MTVIVSHINEPELRCHVKRLNAVVNNVIGKPLSSVEYIFVQFIVFKYTLVIVVVVVVAV